MNKLRRFQNDRSCLYIRDTRDLGQLRKEGWSVVGQPVNDSVWGGVYFAGDSSDNQVITAPENVGNYFKPIGNTDFTFYIQFVNYGPWEDSSTSAKQITGTSGVANAPQLANSWSLSTSNTAGTIVFRFTNESGTNILVGATHSLSESGSVLTAVLTRRNGVLESWVDGIIKGTIEGFVDLSLSNRLFCLGGVENSNTRAARATVLSIGSWSRALMPEEIQALSNDSTFGYLPALPSPINSDNSRLQTLELSEIQSSDFYLYPTGRLLPRLAGRERQYAIQDGVNSGIRIEDTEMLLNRPTSSMAYRMIFKPKVLMTTSDVLFRVRGTSGNNALVVRGTTTGELGFRIADASSNSADIVMPVVLNKWHDTVFVVDREIGQTRLYINGILFNTNNSLIGLGPINGRDFVMLGASNSSNSDPVAADIALFQTFNLVPSAEDIARMYRDPQWIKETWKWGSNQSVTNGTFEVDTSGIGFSNAVGGAVVAEGRNTDEPISGEADYRITLTEIGDHSTHPRFSVATTLPALKVGDLVRYHFKVKVRNGSPQLRHVNLSITSTQNRILFATVPSGSQTYKGILVVDTAMNANAPLWVMLQGNTNVFDIQFDDFELEKLGTTLALLPQNLTSSGWADASTNNYLGTLSSGTTLRIP